MDYTKLRQKIDDASRQGLPRRQDVLMRLIPGLSDVDARTIPAQDTIYLTADELISLDKDNWAIECFNC